MRIRLVAALVSSAALMSGVSTWAGQAPYAASVPDVPISHRDRVYAAEQFSNTVSVTDPIDNKLLGIIRLGQPLPANFSPLYTGQLLVHGMGFSPTTAPSLSSRSDRTPSTSSTRRPMP